MIVNLEEEGFFMEINPPTHVIQQVRPARYPPIKSFTAENHPQKPKLCINGGELFVYKQRWR